MMQALPLLFAGLLVGAESDLDDARVYGTAELVVIRPIGALAEAYVAGVGAYLGAVGKVAGPYALSVRAGYLGFAPNRSDPTRHRLSVIQILGGPRYNFRDSGVLPHLGLNLGLSAVVETSGDEPPVLTLHLAWQLQLGVTIPAPEFGAIEVAGRYNAHFLEQDRMMTGFEIAIVILF